MSKIKSKNRLAEAIIIGIVILAAGYVGAVIGYNMNAPAQASKLPKQTVFVPVKPDVYKLWQLTNAARVTAGLSKLRLNPKLDTSAINKCNDMVAKDYWDHKDPAGRQPWHFITDAGYSYTTAGENLAWGFSSTQALFDGWMNSQVHRTDILRSTYTDVGFGVCHSDNFNSKGPGYIVVQHFGS
jgi:uncharacterized protein YkwD